MSDIELVIKLPEEIRIKITRTGLNILSDDEIKIVDEAIQIGKPIPKGHGRLIDVDKLKCIYPDDIKFHHALHHSKTVVKADKEQEEC